MLAKVKIISPSGGIGSESSGMVSSSYLYFYKVWLRKGLRGNCLDLVVSILPHIKVQDIRVAVMKKISDNKQNKNLNYTIKS